MAPFVCTVLRSVIKIAQHDIDFKMAQRIEYYFTFVIIRILLSEYSKDVNSIIAILVNKSILNCFYRQRKDHHLSQKG